MQQPSFYNSGLASFASLNFDVSGALGLPSSFSSHSSLASQSAVLHSTDLNSPEVFRQNVQLAQAHVARVQTLARSALAGIEHAYHHGTNPVQTTADIASLKQALLALVDLLRQSGVGALPLEPPPVMPDSRTDDQLIKDATELVQALYERQRRIQEGAGVVAGLLGSSFGTGSGTGSGSGSGEQLVAGGPGAGVGRKA